MQRQRSFQHTTYIRKDKISNLPFSINCSSKVDVAFLFEDLFTVYEIPNPVRDTGNTSSLASAEVVVLSTKGKNGNGVYVESDSL